MADPQTLRQLTRFLDGLLTARSGVTAREGQLRQPSGRLSRARPQWLLRMTPHASAQRPPGAKQAPHPSPPPAVASDQGSGSGAPGVRETKQSQSRNPDAPLTAVRFQPRYESEKSYIMATTERSENCRATGLGMKRSAGQAIVRSSSVVENGRTVILQNASRASAKRGTPLYVDSVPRQLACHTAYRIGC